MGNWKGIETVEWQGYEWIKRPLWGTFHPYDPLTWYDESIPRINEKGEMVLDVEDRPKTVDIYGDTQVRKYGRCHVRTTQEFKYGTFEFEMRLPKGKHMLPALWLSSDYSWPPEIDIMEGWSGNTTNYVKRLLFKNIKPTMHWIDPVSGDHEIETKNNICRTIIKGGDHFDHYKCVWTPDYIDIFYNGKKIKRFTDKYMLSQMNQQEVKMHAIMCSGPEAAITDSEFSQYKRSVCPMVVKSFKYTPL